MKLIYHVSFKYTANRFSYIDVCVCVHAHTGACVFFFIYFSIMDYYKILSIGHCAIY